MRPASRATALLGACLPLLFACSESAGPGARTASTLVVVLDGSGAGQVTSLPEGIDCDTEDGDTNCSADFAIGQPVSLLAEAGRESEFDGWSGGCTGNLGCEVVMDVNRSVTATFVAGRSATLTIEVTGDGSGTVTLDPAEAGVSCTTEQGRCTTELSVGSQVSLSADPDEGSDFAGWSGPCSGLGDCAFVLESDATVTAEFDDPTVQSLRRDLSSARTRSPR